MKIFLMSQKKLNICLSQKSQLMRERRKTKNNSSVQATNKIYQNITETMIC